jgi:hypothetical protein
VHGSNVALWLPQMPDLTPTYNLIDRGGVVALLLLGIVVLWLAFQLGWIVPGWLYKKQEDATTEWKTQAQDTVTAIKALTAELQQQRLENALQQRGKTAR